MIYLCSGEICAGSRHVLAAGSGRLPPAGDVIKIYPTLERREILLPEHIVFITVIYYLYTVYVIAGLWPVDGWHRCRRLEHQIGRGVNYLFYCVRARGNNYSADNCISRLKVWLWRRRREFSGKERQKKSVKSLSVCLRHNSDNHRFVI